MTHTTATPRKIQVTFSDAQVNAMLELLRASPLPASPPVNASKTWELGMDLDFLKDLKRKFEGEWSWKRLEERVNEFENYVVEMEVEGGDGGNKETVVVHYVHARSVRDNAVPLLLLHGWPGTVFDFHKVIRKLIEPPAGQPAFHVVVPSLPGFFLSTLPKREDWTLADTSRVMNRLMVDVLGYKKYASQGGDWGSYVLRITGCLFPENAPLSLFNMFRCPAVTAFDYATASPTVKLFMDNRAKFASKGRGYTEIQSTKPFTIGYAIGSSPLGVLSYIGEKFHEWSDPTCLDPLDIVNTTALYYLSGSFPTSVMVYQQNATTRKELSEDPSKWRMKSKIGYHAFPYEIGASPLTDVQQVGDVVFYKEHEKGGHFPALDVPDAFVQDIRECFATF